MLKDLNSPFEFLFRLPVDQLTMIVIAALILTIGPNYIFYKHDKRMGKKYSLIGNPFNAFLKFNRQEWIAMIAVTAIGASLVFIAACSCVV
jgi:hypothetical protein